MYIKLNTASFPTESLNMWNIFKQTKALTTIQFFQWLWGSFDTFILLWISATINALFVMIRK